MDRAFEDQMMMEVDENEVQGQEREIRRLVRDVKSMNLKIEGIGEHLNLGEPTWPRLDVLEGKVEGVRKVAERAEAHSLDRSISLDAQIKSLGAKIETGFAEAAQAHAAFRASTERRLTGVEQRLTQSEQTHAAFRAEVIQAFGRMDQKIANMQHALDAIVQHLEIRPNNH